MFKFGKVDKALKRVMCFIRQEGFLVRFNQRLPRVSLEVIAHDFSSSNLQAGASQISGICRLTLALDSDLPASASNC